MWRKDIFVKFQLMKMADDELITAVTGVEGLLNSRPLTYQSAHRQDVLPLTPKHFRHGQPRGQFAQVKHDRAKLRKKHSKDVLTELIEKCKASKGESVHALQVSPNVRAVLATTSQLKNLEKFCCNPEGFSVFSVDVMIFFVTSTT